MSDTVELWDAAGRRVKKSVMGLSALPGAFLAFFAVLTILEGTKDNGGGSE